MFSQERFNIQLKVVMKLLLLGVVLTVFQPYLMAQKQSYHTLRSFQTVPHALQFDIGKLPNYRFFVGPPYVSNLNITMKSLGPTLNDLGIFRNQDGLFGIDFDNVLKEAEEF